MVLAAGVPGPDRAHLRRIFASSNWRLLEAANVEAVRAALSANAVGVVLCDSGLKEGCWKLLLNTLEELPRPPLLIVASRNADDALWSEVLNLGGYDVLPQPYESREVVRVLSHAWLHWKAGRSMTAAV
jgi:DNA-binding response OmpR family regulator